MELYYDEVVEIRSTVKAPQQRGTSSINTSGNRSEMSGIKSPPSTATAAAAVASSSFAIVPEDTPSAKQSGKNAVATAKKPPDAATDTEDNSSSNSSGTVATNIGQTVFQVDHKEWDKLDVTPDLKEMFQHILRLALKI